MKNLIVGIKLLGLFFLVNSIQSLIQYGFFYSNIKSNAATVEWNNIFPYMVVNVFTLIIACLFVFKSELVAGFIYKPAQSEA